MTQPSGDSGLVEEAGVVVAVKHEPVFRLDDVQEDIEVDETLWIGIGFGLKSVEWHIAADAFEVELHFGQRQPAGIARNLELSHEPSVGVVLVLIASQHRLLHLCQELRGGGVCCGSSTQRNEVDTVSDKNRVFKQRLPGSGNSDDDVVLTAQAA